MNDCHIDASPVVILIGKMSVFSMYIRRIRSVMRKCMSVCPYSILCTSYSLHGTSVVVPYCSCCLCLYFGSSIMLVTYFVNFR